MKNAITVKDFSEFMNTTIWKNLPDKSLLYERYYREISALLCGVKEELKIEDLESLDGLTDRNDFETFIREKSFDELDKQFYAITSELRTWKKHMVDIGELDGTNKIYKGRNKCGKIIVGLLLAFAVVGGIVMIVTSLDAESIVNRITGAILSALDVVLGIVFFLYEWKSDRDKKQLHGSAEKARENGKEDAFINVHIREQINENKGDVINMFGGQITKQYGSDGKAVKSGQETTEEGRESIDSKNGDAHGNR